MNQRTANESDAAWMAELRERVSRVKADPVRKAHFAQLRVLHRELQLLKEEFVSRNLGSPQKITFKRFFRNSTLPYADHWRRISQRFGQFSGRGLLCSAWRVRGAPSELNRTRQTAVDPIEVGGLGTLAERAEGESDRDSARLDDCGGRGGRKRRGTGRRCERRGGTAQSQQEPIVAVFASLAARTAQPGNVSQRATTEATAEIGEP